MKAGLDTWVDHDMACVQSPVSLRWLVFCCLRVHVCRRPAWLHSCRHFGSNARRLWSFRLWLPASEWLSPCCRLAGCVWGCQPWTLCLRVPWTMLQDGAWAVPDSAVLVVQNGWSSGNAGVSCNLRVVRDYSRVLGLTLFVGFWYLLLIMPLFCCNVLFNGCLLDCDAGCSCGPFDVSWVFIPVHWICRSCGSRGGLCPHFIVSKPWSRPGGNHVRKIGVTFCLAFWWTKILHHP